MILRHKHAAEFGKHLWALEGMASTQDLVTAIVKVADSQEVSPTGDDGFGDV
jgi:hypothetical protein